jgi:beta-lactamase superfamily II metal-dependent hydrolase
MIRYYAKTKGSIKSLDGKKVKKLLWGDWLDVEETTPPSNEFIVNWHNWNRDTGHTWTEAFKVLKADCRGTPLLEMIFLDVGQGDGCILSVPDGDSHKVMIIDAGAGRNMANFLRWKTRGFTVGTDFHAAIITHPDVDHYAGFQPVFDQTRMRFDAVWHNGLVERQTPDGSDPLGPRAGGYCTDVIADMPALDQLLQVDANRGRKKYPNLLWTALSDPARFGQVAMLSTLTGERQGGRTWIPGFGPGNATGAEIEVLGPVPEPEPVSDRLRLRVFDDAAPGKSWAPGKTKNGHSVILRLQYGAFSAVFGGDLNSLAEDYLLRHYSGIAPGAPLADAIAEAKKRFGADLLKCCHHGSADVTDEFLQAVNPFAFVLSSGDNETYVHPRPEIIGLLGKHGRGRRPAILSTELQRSSPERMKLSAGEVKRLEALMTDFGNAANAAERAAARKKVDRFWEARMRRLVAVYGAINIRTDGTRLIAAFKVEAGSGWHVIEYEHDGGEWTAKEKARH